MSLKRVVYTRPDGGVSVVVPAPALIMEFQLFGRATGSLLWHGPVLEVPSTERVLSLADAEVAALAYVRTKNIPRDAINIREYDDVEFPPTRRFRSAWRQAGTGPPTVEMPLARRQRMDEVRTERASKLLKSDVDYLRAQEAANLTLQTRLKDYRQKLRDLPAVEQPNVDAITTPDALAAWEPTWPIDPIVL